VPLAGRELGFRSGGATVLHAFNLTPAVLEFDAPALQLQGPLGVGCLEVGSIFTTRAVTSELATLRAVSSRLFVCGGEVMGDQTFTVFLGSDTPFEVREVTDALTAAVLAAAIVRASFTDEETAAAIPGITNPVTLAPVGGSPGDYRAILPDTATFVRGKRVLAVVTIDAGANLNDRREYLGIVEA